MTAELGFVASLLATLVLLGLVVATGLGARRRLHVTCVGATVAALGATIVLAVRMGAHYDLDAAGWITPVHLRLAKVTTLGYLLPVATGLCLWRNPAWRTRHRVCAFLVLGLTILTAVTGTWMILAAERLPASGTP